jgi:hypothetical protein
VTAHEQLYRAHPSLTDGQKRMLSEMSVDAASRVLALLFPAAVGPTTRAVSVMPLGGAERYRICAVLGRRPQRVE